jgi:hypothetical protein
MCLPSRSSKSSSSSSWTTGSRYAVDDSALGGIVYGISMFLVYNCCLEVEGVRWEITGDRCHFDFDIVHVNILPLCLELSFDN